MTIGTWRLLFFILLPLSSSAQDKMPSDFLNSIPLLPQSATEAVRRCPVELDSIVQSMLSGVRANAEAERARYQSDSLRFVNDRKRNPASQGEKQQFDSLKSEFSSLAKNLPRQLSRATVKPSENLIKEIQMIGERLDAEIKQCPKVAGPARATVPPQPPPFSYDSACVAAAEMNAAFNRRHEVQSYLSLVHANWKNDVAAVLQNVNAFDKRIEYLHASVTNQKLILQLRSWRLEIWNLIEETLQTIGGVSQLAAQFSR